MVHATMKGKTAGENEMDTRTKPPLKTKWVVALIIVKNANDGVGQTVVVKVQIG
jgi:hypothetical protein